MLTRRDFLYRSAALAAMSVLPTRALWAGMDPDRQIRRLIPSSGEGLPVIGMGTRVTWNVGVNEDTRRELMGALRQFFDGGGALIDTSPTYGNAERVLGTFLDELAAKNRDNLFAATKVYAESKQAGIDQMKESSKRLGVKVLDLVQIEDLFNWQTQVQTLKVWRAQGKIRYMGITTSQDHDHEELLAALNAESFDFVQCSYSLANREAEKQLLPLALDKGIGVIANRPFEGGKIFEKFKDRPLPEWAANVECTSWAQLFLKFIVSHPAVTCTIPATADWQHMEENMDACYGPLLNEENRQELIQLYDKA